jgi:transcriptional regulatory protein RtcR
VAHLRHAKQLTGTRSHRVHANRVLAVRFVDPEPNRQELLDDAHVGVCVRTQDVRTKAAFARHRERYQPGLSARPEDIEPNLDYELDRWDKQKHQRVTLNREARQLFLDFARSSEGLWLGNFRDFSAAVTRMATLAPGGRIDVATVAGELERLRRLWRSTKASTGADSADDDLVSLLGARAAELDLFERLQLGPVVRVCRESKSLSEAGRRLFAATRAKKQNPNDADRLRKYLARFGLSWDEVRT